MSLQFAVIAGPDLGRTFTVQAGDDLMLGRSEKSYYRLTDPRVSRGHCQLLLQGDKVTVIDHGSSSGTTVNGHRVQRQVLKLGDVTRNRRASEIS